MRHPPVPDYDRPAGESHSFDVWRLFSNVMSHCRAHSKSDNEGQNSAANEANACADLCGGPRHTHSGHGYALDHPLEYRLMFGTPFPDPAKHPEIMESALFAFNLLRKLLRNRRPKISSVELDGEAVFVWSALHGLTEVLRSDVTSRLQLAFRLPDEAVGLVLKRIGFALKRD